MPERIIKILQNDIFSIIDQKVTKQSNSDINLFVNILRKAKKLVSLDDFWQISEFITKNCICTGRPRNVGSNK